MGCAERYRCSRRAWSVPPRPISARRPVAVKPLVDIRGAASPHQIFSGSTATSGCGAEPAGIGSAPTDWTRQLQYISTRDPRAAPHSLSFAEALLAGLAEDGGLYVPDRPPEIGGA